MLKFIRDTVSYLGQMAWIVNLIYTIYGVWQALQLLQGFGRFWQIFQMLETLDPMRGKWVPLPQVGAMLTTFLALGISQGAYRDRRRYPKGRLAWHATWWGVATIAFFFLSFNLYYGLPEEWFRGWSVGSWIVTMLMYWAFGGALGVTATLINELARPSR